MRIRVLFFGMLREMAGKPSDAVELAEGASVRDLLAQYEARIPGLKIALKSSAVAVNQQYADATTVLRNEDEVALLPPVSGGLDDGSRRGR